MGGIYLAGRTQCSTVLPMVPVCGPYASRSRLAFRQRACSEAKFIGQTVKPGSGTGYLRMAWKCTRDVRFAKAAARYIGAMKRLPLRVS